MGSRLSDFTPPEGADLLADAHSFGLVSRVLESLVAARPGRYALYLVRPEAAPLLAAEQRYRSLLGQARRALVLTGWGDPEHFGDASAAASVRALRQSQARGCWATAVLGPDVAMALVATTLQDGSPEGGFLTSDPAAVRRIAATIEACAADPQTELRAV